MDLELIFWTVGGGLALLTLLVLFFVGRTPDECVHAFPIVDKNVDDMEDRWD